MTYQTAAVTMAWPEGLPVTIAAPVQQQQLAGFSCGHCASNVLASNIIVCLLQTWSSLTSQSELLNLWCCLIQHCFMNPPVWSVSIQQPVKSQGKNSAGGSRPGVSTFFLFCSCLAKPIVTETRLSTATSETKDPHKLGSLSPRFQRPWQSGPCWMLLTLASLKITELSLSG